MRKYCVPLSIIAFVTLKQDSDIKTSEIVSLFPLKKNSVTSGLNFFLDYESATISSNTINTLLYLLDYSPLDFQKKLSIVCEYLHPIF